MCTRVPWVFVPARGKALQYVYIKDMPKYTSENNDKRRNTLWSVSTKFLQCHSNSMRQQPQNFSLEQNVLKSSSNSTPPRTVRPINHSCQYISPTFPNFSLGVDVFGFRPREFFSRHRIAKQLGILSNKHLQVRK